MFVTYSDLEKLDACFDQLELFEETFGRDVRVEVNEVNLLLAIEAGLEIDWWLRNAFKEGYEEKSDAIKDEINKKVDALNVEHNKKIDALWDALWVEYYKSLVPIILEFVGRAPVS